MCLLSGLIMMSEVTGESTPHVVSFLLLLLLLDLADSFFVYLLSEECLTDLSFLFSTSSQWKACPHMLPFSESLFQFRDDTGGVYPTVSTDKPRSDFPNRLACIISPCAHPEVYKAGSSITSAIVINIRL